MKPQKFQVALAINFADLARQAQLQSQLSQLQNQYTIYFKKFLINVKAFTLPPLIG